MNALKKIIILITASFILTTLVSCSKSSKLDLDLQSIEGYVLDVAYNDRTDIFYILKQDELSAYKGDQEIQNIELSIETGVVTCYKKDVYVLDCKSGTLYVYDKNLEIKDTIKNDFDCRFIVDIEIAVNKIVYLRGMLGSKTGIIITDLKNQNIEELDLPFGVTNLYKKSNDIIMALKNTGDGGRTYEISLKTNSIINEVIFPQVTILEMAYDNNEDNYYLINSSTMYLWENTDNFDIEPIANTKKTIIVKEGIITIESVVVGDEIYLVYEGELKRFDKTSDEDATHISILGIEYLQVMEAIEEISNEYPDCIFHFNPNIVENGFSFQKLMVDLASESSEYDIYFIENAPTLNGYLDKVNFDTIKEQGYMMDLSQSKVLEEYTDKMFPWVKESCYYDGKLMLVPMNSDMKVVFSEDESFSDMTWETIAQKDLTSLSTDYLLATSYNIERYEYILLGQYMLAFRDEKGHVNFTTDEFSTIINLINKSNDSGFVCENVLSEKKDCTYEFQISRVLNIYSHSESVVGNMYPIPVYNNAKDIKTPVAIRYACINPNTENKEIAIKLMEEISNKVYEDHNTTLDMLFTDIERYTSIVESPRQIELVTQAYNLMENGSAYVDSSFIAYAVNELFPIYKEGAMSKEEFTEYFIEKYEMWYKEQR